MDKEDQKLLLSVCNGLGTYEQDEKGNRLYRKDDDCLACLKDLQAFLRHDSPDTRDAFFVLGGYNISRNDLVPILMGHPGDTELVFNALKVLTLLTMPVDPQDLNTESPQKQIAMQQLVKESLVSQPDALAALVMLVSEPLSHHPRMSEQEASVVQLLLVFVRNLLAIPDAAVARGSSVGYHKTRMQESLLSAMFKENVMELLLLVAEHAKERPFRGEVALIMAIFDKILKCIDPTEAATAVDPAVAQAAAALRAHSGLLKTRTLSGGAGSGSGKAVDPLQAVLAAEHRARSSKVTGAQSKHALNSGRFMRVHNEHAPQVYLRNPNSVELKALPLPNGAGSAHGTSNSTAQGGSSGGGGAAPRSINAALTWQLRGYCQEFLRSGYNCLLEVARRELEPGLGVSRLTSADFVAFLSLVRFFTSFVATQQQGAADKGNAPSRSSSKPVAASTSSADASPSATSPFTSISATMGWETFHMLQVLWTSQVDNRLKDRDWGIQARFDFPAAWHAVHAGAGAACGEWCGSESGRQASATAAA
ncbi:MAG: hypothetical protein WDW36_002121 [Sanguina aurantia]